VVSCTYFFAPHGHEGEAAAATRESAVDIESVSPHEAGHVCFHFLALVASESDIHVDLLTPGTFTRLGDLVFSRLLRLGSGCLGNG
jgi:hypothetical protein